MPFAHPNVPEIAGKLWSQSRLRNVPELAETTIPPPVCSVGVRQVQAPFALAFVLIISGRFPLTVRAMVIVTRCRGLCGPKFGTVPVSRLLGVKLLAISFFADPNRDHARTRVSLLAEAAMVILYRGSSRSMKTEAQRG